MDTDTILTRARSALNKGIRYKLGKGGMKPESATPAAGGQCDCSGFVAWCLGMSRQTKEPFYVQQNGGWIETTAMWKDIGSPNAGILAPVAAPVAGAIIVFPDSNGKQGHVGILTSPTTAIHCSKGNDTKFGDSVQETGLGVFGSNYRLGKLT
jgi:hypothetical protein